MTDHVEGASRVSPAGEHPLSLTAIADIVGVRPAVVRSWVEHALLSPAHRAGGVLFFSFRQTGVARALARLWQAGFHSRRVAKALLRVRAVIADPEAALAGLEASIGSGHLCVRMPDGRVAELDGQLLFDFGAGAGDGERRPAGGRIRGLRSAADWFQAGVEAEAGGRLTEAIHAYEQALRGVASVGEPAAHGSSAEVAFNLGNCLYAMGRRGEARDRFAAAVAAEPEYAEAWNNLGNVEGELGNGGAAIEAYRRALAIVPYYADAHYNLADALAAAGDLAAARRHWSAYLSYDPNSRWAEQVRRRLGGRTGARSDGEPDDRDS